MFLKIIYASFSPKSFFFLEIWIICVPFKVRVRREGYKQEEDVHGSPKHEIIRNNNKSTSSSQYWPLWQRNAVLDITLFIHLPFQRPLCFFVFFIPAFENQRSFQCRCSKNKRGNSLCSHLLVWIEIGLHGEVYTYIKFGTKGFNCGYRNLLGKRSTRMARVQLILLLCSWLSSRQQ